jgi:hypothetical protein
LCAQVLQLLEADDLIVVETLTALEIALRLARELACLLDLRIDFGELDLGEALALLHLIAGLHVNGANHAAELERQAHLVLGGDDAVGGDRRRCRPGGGGLHPHWGRPHGLLLRLLRAGREESQRYEGKKGFHDRLPVTVGSGSVPAAVA